MNIPENVKRIILENFTDANYPISSVLKMVNKEYDMTIEELYAFLEQYEEETGEVLIRSTKKIGQNVKDIIFELRLQGKAYYRIAGYLKDSGITLSTERVKKICERVFKERGMIEPDTKNNDSYKMIVIVKDSTIDYLKNKGMNDEDIKEYFKKYGVDINKPEKYYEEDKYGIYEVLNNYIFDYIYSSKKDGKSYRNIVNELYEIGIETSRESVRKHCKRIFNSKNEKIPPPINRNEELDKNNPYYSDVYELRKQGLTYKQIKDEINSKYDKNLSMEAIRGYCKKIFKSKNESVPKKSPVYDINKNQMSHTIYELRKQGLTYQQIADELIKQGINVKPYTVAYRCKVINEMENENYKFNRGRRVRIEPIDIMIYNLRLNRYSDSRIIEFLDKKGITISRANVIHKTNRIFKIKNEEVPKSIFRKNSKRVVKTNVDNKQIIDAAYKIAKKKKANKEQLDRFIKEVSKMYNTDLKVNIDYNEKER